jgi:hypothetical protein
MTADLLRVRSHSHVSTAQTNTLTTASSHTHTGTATASKTAYMDDNSMDPGFTDGGGLYGNSAFPWMDLLTWDPEQGL